MYEVVVLARSFSRAAPDPREILERAGCTVKFKKDPEPENEEVVAGLIGNACAVIVGVDKVGETVFSRCPHLEVVSKHGVGVDNVDLDAARRYKIVVTNAPGTNSESVADMAFALLLAQARRIPYFLDQVRKKVWSSSGFAVELEEKVLGVVGFGRIGKAMAQRARGFGMKVVFYDPLVEGEGDYEKVSLEELFSRADFVSLHAPLLQETRKMVNQKMLSLMKNEAYLINTARGELVDEEALFRFLKEERIAGAALDVFTEEPPFDSPLMNLPNVTATPHVAAHTREANIKMGTIAARNVVQVLRGEEPLFRVV